ncbi:putative DNA-binding transcriptional activator AlpA [Burkholderia diffusa]|uniref:helix-turn-helix transcriptional regulator n=1 Tax=Burkholderia diffusa TaxID=488732 RepID=UPI001CB53D30|nr:AlpA family transcriptional regulator [Burkholderia diffusa]CAG9252401.1 putative DNA-binding transcriptional activator AlpA [Burkholderia diffusa]
MGDRLLRVADVSAKVALEQSTLFEMVRDGRFPRPIRLSSRASRWSEAEIDAWIDARLAEREGTELHSDT